MAIWYVISFREMLGQWYLWEEEKTPWILEAKNPSENLTPSNSNMLEGLKLLY